MIVSAGGAELFYVRIGSGPLLLVPSSLGTKPYEAQLARLSQDFELVIVDLRGSGRSTGDPADLTFDRLAEDLEAVRRDVGAGQVAVLGHSILGALAIEYGRRCPESVSRVVTAGTPPKGDMSWVAAEAEELFEKDASPDRKQALRENLERLPPHSLQAQTPKRFYDARFDTTPLFAEAAFNPAFFQHLLGPLTQDWDVTVDAGSLRVPILATHGRYDYAVPHFLWDEVAGALPGVDRHLFERSGHQPFFEEPEEFVRVLRGWMER